jgi:type IV pilus assembly protein PilB
VFARSLPAGGVRGHHYGVTERLRLGDMLVRAGLVTDAQVSEALARQKQTGQRLGETLVAMGLVTEAQMTQMLSNQLSIPWVNLYHVDFSRELLARVPAEVAEQYRLVPVYVRQVRRQGDTLFVAMEDPLNLDAMQAVADRSGLPVKSMVAPPSDIQNAIRVYYLGLPPATPEPPDPEITAEESDEELDYETGEPVSPTMPAPAVSAPSGFMTLTLLDGTVVRLPGASRRKDTPSMPTERGLTTRDLIHALRARAAGEDVSRILPDEDWEALFAALLSTLMRKGLIADWEFVDEWKKHRKG